MAIGTMVTPQYRIEHTSNPPAVQCARNSARLQRRQ